MSEQPGAIQMTEEQLAGMLAEAFNEGSMKALEAVKKMLEGLEQLIQDEIGE